MELFARLMRRFGCAPVDKAYSEMHEVECEGERRSFLKITIKTPMGKVKFETKIY